MSSRNPTVSSSTMFSKKIKKSMPPISIVTEAAAPVEEAPDFLRSLNIIRAPPKPAEPSLPCRKTETEEIIAAMKKALMASPAPTPVILPKKRKRPIYDFKHLAEKIAKHDHNAILNPKIEEEVIIDNTIKTVIPPVPVVVKNKGKNLMNQVEVGLIKQNRLRKKRVIPPIIPKKAPKVPPKKAKIEAKIEIKEETVINVVESIPAEKIKSQVQVKKKAKVSKKKAIDENFASRVQTRNRKKNFIEESLSNVTPSLEKEVKPLNNNNESSSSFVDVESSQEVSLSDVPPKNNKTVKVNPFKPKARNRRKPGVFFGSRKRKRNLKTENKKRQPSNKVNEISKLKSSDSNSLVSEQINVKVFQNGMKEPIKDIKTEVIVPTEPQKSPKTAQNESIKIEVTVLKEQQKLPKSTQIEPTKTEVIIPKEPQESPKPTVKEPTKFEVVLNEFQESPISAQNESPTVIVTEENKVAAPTTTADTTAESKEPEEATEPHWQTQSDGFFDLPSEVSLGSILSSVNQAS